MRTHRKLGLTGLGWRKPSTLEVGCVYYIHTIEQRSGLFTPDRTPTTCQSLCSKQGGRVYGVSCIRRQVYLTSIEVVSSGEQSSGHQYGGGAESYVGHFLYTLLLGLRPRANSWGVYLK